MRYSFLILNGFMMNAQPVHPQFVQTIHAGLRYWQTQMEDNSDEAIRRLDADRHNLYRIVQFGQWLPEMWRDTAVIALQAFYLVERKGYWPEWIPILEQAVAHWVQDDLPLKGQLLNRLGYLYQISRQLSQAVATHAQAEQIARQLQDARLLNHVFFNLCADYRHLRQYEKAEKYGLLALAGFEQQNAEDKWKAITLNELGMIAHFQRDLLLARQRLERAAALHRQNGQPTDLLRTLNNLMGVARTEKNYDLALAYYQEASLYFDKISSEFDRTVFETAIGGTLFELGRYSEAEAAFRRANSPYLQRSSHIYYRALVWQCLGITLFKQNRLEEAEGCLRESADLWSVANDNLMLANTLGTLGELHEAKNQPGLANTYLDRALEHLDRYPDDATAVRLRAEYLALKDSLNKK